MAISLQEIQQFYIDNLENRIFRYKLRGGQVIDLAFHKENLCHLLGIQHIFPKNKEFVGIRGYKKIQDGTLTIATMRKYNATQYRQMRNRIEKFMEVAHLLVSGSIYKFYFMRQKESNIRADFIIYWHNEEHGLYSNLFLAKECSLILADKDDRAYIAISYTVMKEKDDHDKYIRDKEYKEVEAFQIITRNKMSPSSVTEGVSYHNRR